MCKLAHKTSKFFLISFLYIDFVTKRKKQQYKWTMFPPFWGYFQVLVKYTKKIRAYNNGSQTDENVASIKNVLIII